MPPTNGESLVSAPDRAAHPTIPGIRARLVTVCLGSVALALGAMVLAPLAGSTSISLAHAFDLTRPWASNVDAQIFFVARLPRVLAAALVGGALAASGVVFQALLRNPLASARSVSGNHRANDCAQHGKMPAIEMPTPVHNRMSDQKSCVQARSPHSTDVRATPIVIP